MATAAIDVSVAESQGSPAADPMWAGAVDVLSDEVLEQLCICLPGRELLRFAAAAKQLHVVAHESAVIWSHLSKALLGESICQLHTTLWARRGRPLDVTFWKHLFHRGSEFKAARWSLDLRAQFLQSAGQGDDAEQRFHSATVGSGHCTVAVGRFVVKVGGLRPQCQLSHLHASTFDLQSLTVREVELTSGSAKPERRLRHAACAICPMRTSRKPAVLVLGGCDDRTKKPCEGGLRLLHILELLGEDGSKGCWHSVPAGGDAPTAIWHHVCGASDGGKQVVVFGGDFRRMDPEFETISDRTAPAGHVYILDVDQCMWSRVRTSGPAPTWRSLHTGFTHCDVSSHAERLVVLGGCSEHTQIFGSSEVLAEMHGHALDLKTFAWQPQPADAPAPPAARIRFAAEKVGEWLLLYGGHSSGEEVGEISTLCKLNLRTLRWGSLRAYGREGSYPAAPATTLAAGLALGGVQFGVFGISPVPKLDVLTLCPENQKALEISAEEEADKVAEQNGSPWKQHMEAEEEELQGGGNQLVAVVLRGANGTPQRMVVPLFALQQLLARRRGSAGSRRARGRGGDEVGDEDDLPPRPAGDTAVDDPLGSGDEEEEEDDEEAGEGEGDDDDEEANESLSSSSEEQSSSEADELLPRQRSPSSPTFAPRPRGLNRLD